MQSYVVAFVFIIGLCSAAVKNSRIVGGTPSQIEQFPFIVQTELFASWGSWRTWCGGNIINNFYILSAAHCFMGDDINERINDYRIRAGSEYTGAGGDLYEAASILNHPGFIYNYPDEMSLEDDINLIRLRTSIRYSDKVVPIAIVVANFEVPDNAPVTYAGWGAIRTGGPAPDVLLHVNVTTVNRDICAEAYANAEYPLYPSVVTEKMICAGLPGQGACNGDSGGPLIYGGVLVGIVSFGSGICATEGYPEVCARVASYTGWIVNNAV